MEKYCSVDDVKQKLQQIEITSLSDPTELEVDEWCRLTTVNMKSEFRAAGIVLPITDSEKLSMLSDICSDGVCARVLMYLELQEDRSSKYNELYEGAMTKIVKNPGILTITTSVIGGGVSYYTDPNQRGRKFRRESRDW